MSIPVNYEGLREYNTFKKVAGRVSNDENVIYYMRALYQRIISGTNFKLPDSWKQGRRYFKNVLFSEGFIGVFDTPKYGIIPQICAPSGYGLFLQPTELLCAQPLVQMTGTIGKDCEIIHLTNDWRGVWDICEHYASRLATAAVSLDVSLVNSRVSFLGAAKNKAANETLKLLYEGISAGEPFKTYDKATLKDDDLKDTDPIWIYQQKVKENYITNDIIDAINEILRLFDNEVGILALPDKKERMIIDEVTTQNDDATARASSWFEELSESIENVNNLFGLDIGFSMRYGGNDHAYNYNDENNINRTPAE